MPACPKPLVFRPTQWLFADTVLGLMEPPSWSAPKCPLWWGPWQAGLECWPHCLPPGVSWVLRTLSSAVDPPRTLRASLRSPTLCRFLS